ncbi:MAG: hypothetical protein IPM23_24695 [Candidatus Melainabacteria bacterium]|nr:hypothetical protein [Candidatus Melainabacteria bacterium]
MNQDQLETDLARLAESVARIIQKLEAERDQDRSPDLASIIESLAVLRQDIVRAGSHQGVSVG